MAMVKKIPKIEPPKENPMTEAEEELYNAMQHADTQAVVLPTSEFIPVALPKQGVSTDICQEAVLLVSEVFNLKDKGYVLANFDDKGETVKVTLASHDFIITVVIRDSESAGLRD